MLQLEGKIGKFTIIVGGFSTPLSFIIGRPRQHKIIKDIDNWKNPINYDLIDIYHTVNPSWEIDGETVETVSDFILGAPESLQMVIAAMKLKDAYSLEGKLWPT